MNQRISTFVAELTSEQNGNISAVCASDPNGVVCMNYCSANPSAARCRGAIITGNELALTTQFNSTVTSSLRASLSPAALTAFSTLQNDVLTMTATLRAETTEDEYTNGEKYLTDTESTLKSLDPPLQQIIDLGIAARRSFLSTGAFAHYLTLKAQLDQNGDTVAEQALRHIDQVNDCTGLARITLLRDLILIPSASSQLQGYAVQKLNDWLSNSLSDTDTLCSTFSLPATKIENYYTELFQLFMSTSPPVTSVTPLYGSVASKLTQRTNQQVQALSFLGRYGMTANEVLSGETVVTGYSSAGQLSFSGVVHGVENGGAEWNKYPQVLQQVASDLTDGNASSGVLSPLVFEMADMNEIDAAKLVTSVGTITSTLALIDDNYNFNFDLATFNATQDPSSIGQALTAAVSAAQGATDSTTELQGLSFLSTAATDPMGLPMSYIVAASSLQAWAQADQTSLSSGLADRARLLDEDGPQFLWTATPGMPHQFDYAKVTAESLHISEQLGLQSCSQVLADFDALTHVMQSWMQTEIQYGWRIDSSSGRYNNICAFANSTAGLLYAFYKPSPIQGCLGQQDLTQQTLNAKMPNWYWTPVRTFGSAWALGINGHSYTMGLPRYATPGCNYAVYADTWGSGDITGFENNNLVLVNQDTQTMMASWQFQNAQPPCEPSPPPDSLPDTTTSCSCDLDPTSTTCTNFCAASPKDPLCVTNACTANPSSAACAAACGIDPISANCVAHCAAMPNDPVCGAACATAFFGAPCRNYCTANPSNPECTIECHGAQGVPLEETTSATQIGGVCPDGTLAFAHQNFGYCCHYPNTNQDGGPAIIDACALPYSQSLGYQSFGYCSSVDSMDSGYQVLGDTGYFSTSAAWGKSGEIALCSPPDGAYVNDYAPPTRKYSCPTAGTTLSTDGKSCCPADAPGCSSGSVCPAGLTRSLMGNYCCPLNDQNCRQPNNPRCPAPFYPNGCQDPTWIRDPSGACCPTLGYGGHCPN